MASAYDRWSECYDCDANPTRDLDATTLRAQSLDLGGRDVLEVGCGTAKNTSWLARNAREVTAMDFSAGMLEKARMRLSGLANVRFVCHDLREPWPVPVESCDCVVGTLVLEHVEDLEHAYREVWRVLRVGGLYYSSELHPYRQMLGKQARFRATGEAAPTAVTAYHHDVSDYARAGLAVGLSLRGLDEIRDPGADVSVPPRLLVMRWTKERRTSGEEEVV